jgi:hypothetical protein
MYLYVFHVRDKRVCGMWVDPRNTSSSMELDYTASHSKFYNETITILEEAHCTCFDT